MSLSICISPANEIIEFTICQKTFKISQDVLIDINPDSLKSDICYSSKKCILFYKKDRVTVYACQSIDNGHLNITRLPYILKEEKYYGNIYMVSHNKGNVVNFSRNDYMELMENEINNE
jgi:hypothetical protein